MKGLRSAPAPTSGMLAALAKSTATSSPSLKPSVTSVTLLLLVPTVICLGLKVFPWRDQTKPFMENRKEWHQAILNEEDYKRSLDEVSVKLC